MTQKSLLHIVAMFVIAITLTACGGKGLDGKLNFTLTDVKTVLGNAYGEALEQAPPEQQNVLREQMLPVMLTVFTLATDSNPATVEAFQAKKNADEFSRLSKMSVREIVVAHLEENQNFLNGIVPELKKFHSGATLKLDSFSIGDINPMELTESSERIDMPLTLSLRNDSDSFDYSIHAYLLAMTLDGRQIGDLSEAKADSADGQNVTIKSKGGKITTKLGYRITGKENTRIFYDFYKSGQMGEIGFNFKPSTKNAFSGFMIRLSSDTHPSWIEAHDGKFKDYEAELQKVTSDLAVMKK